MSKQYTLLVCVALIAGAPVSYIFTKAYLNMLFAYPMPMDYSGILVSIVIVCCSRSYADPEVVKTQSG